MGADALTWHWQVAAKCEANQYQEEIIIKFLNLGDERLN